MKWLRLVESLPLAAPAGSGGGGGDGRGGRVGGGTGGGDGIASWTIVDDAVAWIGGEQLKVEVAGWRRGRPTVLVPDWICVPTAADRETQLARYAGQLSHVWLLDQQIRQIYVYRWRRAAWEFVTLGATRLRAEPFADVELDLSSLWAAPS